MKSYNFHDKDTKKKAQDGIDVIDGMLRQNLKKFGIDLDEVRNSYVREIAMLESAGDVFDLAKLIAYNYGKIDEDQLNNDNREDYEIDSLQASKMLTADDEEVEPSVSGYTFDDEDEVISVIVDEVTFTVGDNVQFLGGPEGGTDTEDYGDLDTTSVYHLTYIHPPTEAEEEVLVDIQDQEDSTFAYEFCDLKYFKLADDYDMEGELNEGEPKEAEDEEFEDEDEEFSEPEKCLVCGKSIPIGAEAYQDNNFYTWCSLKCTLEAFEVRKIIHE